jgi:hypothetical protein
MGDKAGARQLAAQLGVETPTGYDERQGHRRPPSHQAGRGRWW